VADDERGWGRSGETWHALEEVARLDGEAWFKLGDRDLGLHLVRTQALRSGEPLSAVTARVSAALDIEVTLLPATDDRLRTWVDTPAGSFSFQEWFVARSHEDEVDRVRFEGEESARAAPGVVESLERADVIVIAPSNPFISIWPILAVGEIRRALEVRTRPCVAVSPIVGGKALKGPADRMLDRLAGGTGPDRVATCYQGLADVLVIDEVDAAAAEEVEGQGVRCVVAETVMRDGDSARALARAVLDAAAAPAAGG
jgi:LPPG:FO 2-phospho-L-lactate transferase